ncbi:MAG TPA: protein kinase [Polyangiaceae bacterium]|jgi:serine/threonine-protein kinase
MSLSPGELISGKYRIVRLIGDGGMGTVYEAHHEVLDANVALKFLHPELAKRPGLGSRFLQEARVSARIHSPHVTQVTDVDTAQDGSPYLVMELLRGESLQAVLDRNRKLPQEVAIDFALQILAGLEAAHDVAVVHRDLKPDNVLVTPVTNGSLLKLIDFGIAKLRASSEFQKGLTRAGSIMGTPEYMAPEQLFAAEGVDHRADLYSLGVMLFEMLSGQRPADGNEPDEIVARVVSGNVKHLAELEPSLAPGLVAVVERAILADREARFASAREFRQALLPFAATSHLPPGAPHSASAAAQMPQNAGGPQHETRTIPKTLPPDADPAMRANKGNTQEVPDNVMQEALRTSALPAMTPAPHNYQYAAYAPTAPGAQSTAQRSSSGARIFAIVSLIGILALGAAGAGVYFYLQQQEQDSPAPPLPLPSDVVAPQASVAPLVDPGLPPTPPVAPGLPPPIAPNRPTTPGVPIAPRADGGASAKDAGAPRDAGTGVTFPFPLPSTFPPLPSTFPALPTSLPTAFPTAFPPGFPIIPGLTPPKLAGDGGK